MQQIILIFSIGLLAGGVSGLFGIGGGIIVIPLLVITLGFSQQLAQGTSLALLLPPIGILAVMNYHKAGYVDMKTAGIMIIAFIVGSYFSSKFAVNLPEDIMKKIFAVFLMLYALQLFFKK